MALSDKKLFLLDMDGTIYLDDNLFEGVTAFLRYVKSVGGRYLFLTNNSSRGVDGYVEKLRRLGIDAVADDFLTSVDATIRCLDKEYPRKKCYVMGTRSFYGQLQQAGIPITDKLEDDIDILLCGFDRELTFQKLEDACKLLPRGVTFLATNPDWVCPTEFGSVPDCGSVCQMLTTATGKTPRFIGKPQPEMVYLALEKTGFDASQAVMIGDRVYTDIACGVNAGIDTVFVLSGEGVPSDVEKFDVHPTWIYDHIKDFYHDLEANNR